MPAPLKAETEQRRRNTILKAATDVFARQGFRGSTIKDIAKIAGVSDGTIYNAFPNKDALLTALLDKLRPELRGPAAPPPDAKLEDLLPQLLQQRAETFTPDTLKILRFVLSEALVDFGLRTKFLKRVIMPAIEPLDAQFKHPDENRLIVAMFMGVVVLQLLGEPHVIKNAKVMPQKMAAIFAKGLAA
jgi:AcrR family transcriptional regulator